MFERVLGSELDPDPTLTLTLRALKRIRGQTSVRLHISRLSRWTTPEHLHVPLPEEHLESFAKEQHQLLGAARTRRGRALVLEWSDLLSGSYYL